jgi:hypothetical protein
MSIAPDQSASPRPILATRFQSLAQPREFRTVHNRKQLSIREQSEREEKLSRRSDLKLTQQLRRDALP